MITDRAAYELICERERWDRLRSMTLDESVAVLEALLSSGLEEIAVPPARLREPA